MGLRWLLVLFEFGLFIKAKILPCSEGLLSEVCYKDDHYSTAVFPPGNRPVQVNMSFWFRDVVSINEEKQSITIFLNLGITWRDQRLSVNRDEGDIPWYLMKTSDILDIWSPMFYLMNSLDVKRHGSYGGGLTNIFWYGYPSLLDYKEVMYVTFSCDMTFELFPYDKHTCYFKMRCYNGAVQDVKLEPALYFEDSETDLQVHEIRQKSAKQNFDLLIKVEKPSETQFQSWNYSLVNLRIDMKRNQGSFEKVLIGFYIPTGIFAFMSLISFAIHPDLVPGRMGMLVTLYLILINTYSSMDAPSKRGFSYADVWFVACQTPIAFAIIEYGTVLILLRSQECLGADKSVKILDTISCIISLLYLLAFNLTYWLYLTK